MPVTTQLNDALVEYRQMLQADGADLELTDVDAGVAQIKLIFGPETCVDCILDKGMLETILLNGLRKTDDGLAQVVVDDPREAG